MKLLLMCACCLFTASLALAAVSYKYECPKCRLIQTYGMPGIYKCFKDGWTMTMR